MSRKITIMGGFIFQNHPRNVTQILLNNLISIMIHKDRCIK